MTSEEFLIVLQKYIDGMQLPSAMSSLAQIAKQLKDGSSNTLAQRAMSVATAAQGDNDRLIKCLKAAGQYFSSIQTEVSPPPGIHVGTDTVVDGGPDDPVNLSTGVTGETWVQSDSVIVGWIPYEPIISDPESGFWDVAINDITVGDGFDFMVVNRSAPAGTPYSMTIHWFAFNP